MNGTKNTPVLINLKKNYLHEKSSNDRNDHFVLYYRKGNTTQ